MALGYDTDTVSSKASAASSVTFAHVCTGSNLALAVVSYTKDSGDTDGVVTDITYNSVSLSVRDSELESGGNYLKVYVRSMPGPASGSNNVVITWAGNVTGGQGWAYSVTGADQTTENDATATGQAATGKPTLDITSATDDAIMIAALYDKQSTESRVTTDTDGGAVIERHKTDSGSDVIFGTDRISPGGAGAKTFSWTDTDNDEFWIIVEFAFKAAGVAGPTFIPKIWISELFTNPMLFFAIIFGIGCIRDTKLNRRNFFNPFEWLK